MKGWSFGALTDALRGAAFLDVGTKADTVAAGNDSRIVNSVQNTFKINGIDMKKDINLTPADVKAVALTGDKMTGGLEAPNYRATDTDFFRHVGKKFGTIMRCEDDYFFLLITDENNQEGNFNGMRPFYVNLNTGQVTMSRPVVFNDIVTSSAEIEASFNGANGFVNQYGVKAAFYETYTDVKGDSKYHPLIKQQARIANTNAYAFSMGTLTNGSDLQWSLHMIGSAGQSQRHYWDTSGNYRAPGTIVAGEELQANGGDVRLASDGNVYGSMWGGWLANWLNGKLGVVSKWVRTGSQTNFGQIGSGSKVVSAGYVMVGLNSSNGEQNTTIQLIGGRLQIYRDSGGWMDSSH